MLARRIDDCRTLSSTAVHPLRIRFFYATSPYPRYRDRDCNVHRSTYRFDIAKPFTPIYLVASNPSKQRPACYGANLTCGAGVLAGSQHSRWNRRRVRLPWLSATTIDPLVWNGSNRHRSVLRALRLSSLLSRHNRGSTNCLSRRNLWHRRDTARESARCYDCSFSPGRYGGHNVVSTQLVVVISSPYRSTASATEFPPPKQSAATPFFTSRRIIS
jgi:hypothetical protein